MTTNVYTDLSLTGSGTHEAQLWQAFNQERSQATRNALFGFYVRFAHSIARHHFRDRQRGDIELADLIQLASAGLLEALDRFDPSRGVPFTAYARRRIAGSIVDGIGLMSEWRSQAGAHKRASIDRIESLTPAHPEQGADWFDAFKELAVGLALGYMLEDAGFRSGFEDAVVQGTAYDSLLWRQTLRAVATAVESLPNRERLIIVQHYEGGLSFEGIGVLLGVTKGRVSQLHKAALALLRKRVGHASAFGLNDRGDG